MFNALSVEQKAGAETISVTGDNVIAAFLRKEKQSMNDVIAVYDDLLKLNKTGKIIIISSSSSSCPSLGEHRLCPTLVPPLWQQGSLEKKEALSALLKFFVKVSKEDNAAHVVLATSDFAFQSWLAREIGVGFFRCEVIALAVVWGPLLSDLELALVDTNPWSEEHFKTVVKLIIAAANGVVPVSRVCRALGAGAKTALDGMVQANLLAYRPYSLWARDLPAEAHGPYLKTVVTAPTPGHLYSMRQLEKSGDLVSMHTSAQEQKHSAAAILEDRLRKNSAQIKKIDKSLAAIDKELTKLDGEVADLKRTTARDVWLNEVAELRRKEELLRKEKEQLWREKEQLRELEIILSRQLSS
ncbi:hypothetical protein COCOBI_14-0300 [Coccomyxa sp. Obi]|nr:hypothetical protein COCOBI_14-0300 [Coccomyxa sp. Obi]